MYVHDDVRLEPSCPLPYLAAQRLLALVSEFSQPPIPDQNVHKCMEAKSFSDQQVRFLTKQRESHQNVEIMIHIVL